MGGRGADALPFAPLSWHPAVATLMVPERGPVLLRRTTAAVVVKVNGEPLGVKSVELSNGASVEFRGCQFTFDASSAPPVHTGTNAAMVGAAASTVTGPGGQAHPAAAASCARLIDSRTGRAVELDNRRVVIGRDEGCDIVVANGIVSRRHASIAPVQGGFQLRDESANGTVVNGVRIGGTTLLSHGDVIRMHDVELRVELHSARASAPGATGAEATELLDLSDLVGDEALADIRRSAAHTFSATLEIVRGPCAGASFQLDKAVCSLGRGEQCDVRLRGDSVSSMHASLLRKGATWYVIDLRSVNGTFVEGYRIAGERELPSGASLRLGAVELLFRSFEGGDEVAPRKQRRSGLLRWLASLLRPPFGEAA